MRILQKAYLILPIFFLFLGLEVLGANAAPSQENYQFISKWGNLGSGDGQFDIPTGVAAGSSGNVYVSDTFNNSIQKFGLRIPPITP